MEYIKTVKDYIEKIEQFTNVSDFILEDKILKKLSEVTHDFENFSIYNDTLKKKVKRISNNKSLHNSRFSFYFRGHYNENYFLIPSVFRDYNWNKEDYYYHEMLVRCPNSFVSLSHLDKLVLMQHYDCPTRLLDVTTNPLVALYFACKNFGCPKCNKANHGIIFLFPVLASEISYFDSDKALMLSCLPKFSNNEKTDLYSTIINRISNEKNPNRFLHIKGKPKYTPPIVERFYHEITTEMPSFQRDIVPLDLLQPLFVQPKKMNDRIIKQDGAFILSGLSANEEEARLKIDSISSERICVKESDKESILKELEVLGIHEASLFPEVDKVAAYLKQK